MPTLNHRPILTTTLIEKLRAAVEHNAEGHYSLYVLYDNETKEIFYAGISEDTQRRFKRHLAYGMPENPAYTLKREELLKRGPDAMGIWIVANVDDYDDEKPFISELRKHGKITNIHCGGLAYSTDQGTNRGYLQPGKTYELVLKNITVDNQNINFNFENGVRLALWIKNPPVTYKKKNRLRAREALHVLGIATRDAFLAALNKRLLGWKCHVTVTLADNTPNRHEWYRIERVTK